MSLHQTVQVVGRTLWVLSEQITKQKRVAERINYSKHYDN